MLHFYVAIVMTVDVAFQYLKMELFCVVYFCMNVLNSVSCLEREQKRNTMVCGWLLLLLFKYWLIFNGVSLFSTVGQLQVSQQGAPRSANFVRLTVFAYYAAHLTVQMTLVVMQMRCQCTSELPDP